MSNAVKISQYQRPVNLIEIASRDQARKPAGTGNDVSFKDVLAGEIGGTREVTFSRHASQRLHSRGIELNREQLGKIAGALDKAEAKGSKETLILSDEAAMVASVPNRTIITVFDRDNLKEGVVTSIDSAVII